MYETSNLPSLLFSPSSLRHFQTKMIASLQDATMALAENSSGQTAAEVAMRTFAQQT